MHRLSLVVALCLTVALPALGQQGQNNDILVQAQQVVSSAESAGAAIFAPTLLNEARTHLQWAQSNWSNSKARETSQVRAAEAIAAARAALAKSRWLSTNAAIRNLQQDINRFGGSANVTLTDEQPDMAINRGTTSRQRVEYAQGVIEQARRAGGEQVPGNNLASAQASLESARRIAKGGDQRPTADHLAYLAEMTARYAYYSARLAESERQTPGLQLERTRLAQADSERRANAERMQREQAERAAADLRRQLEAEQANRQAAASELERLRTQVDENRRAIESRAEADRAARVQAEQQFDALMRQYESALATGAPSEVDTLRRQVEDQQIALRSMWERERMNEQATASELEVLRRDLAAARQQGIAADVVAQREADVARREAELTRQREARAAELAHRQELEQQQQAAIAETLKRRQEAEAQAETLRQQILAAQQTASSAQQAADQAQQAAAAATSVAQQTQAELDRARTEAAQTQAELERTRQQLAQRDADATRLQMETELGRIASTRRDERGFIITLPGIFFDTGKSQLKSGSKTTLTRIAEQLSKNSSVALLVEGHTDSVGGEASNQALSEARANAVRTFLVDAGVPADRLTAAGRGEGQPIATNKTAAGRQQNRRVEIVIANQ